MSKRQITRTEHFLSQSEAQEEDFTRMTRITLIFADFFPF